jgi:heat shock protein HslJ
VIPTLKQFAPFAFAAMLVSCAQNKVPAATASAAIKGSLAAETLSGPYEVERVNGAKALSSFGIDIGPNSFGGDDGCNSYFGTGFGYLDTYYTGVTGTTLVGCISSSRQGKRRLSQGGTVAGIMISNPTVENLGEGRYRLSAGLNDMIIKGSPNPLSQANRFEAIPLAGTSWEAFLLNDKRAAEVKTLKNQYLRFADTTFTARFTCRYFSGNYAANGVRLKFSEVKIEQRGDCNKAQDAEDAALLQLLSGEVGFVATKNGIVLGSPSGTLSGDDEREEYKVR